MKLSEKVCRTCGNKKDISCFSFRKDTGKPRSQCKKCRVLYTKKYIFNNPEKRVAWRKRNHGKKYDYEIIEPWRATLYGIRNRCGRIGKYINRKCLITEEELKILWFRDKAYLLKSPSIDRIDNEGDYTFENCRYIERRDNSRLGTHAHKNKKIGQYKDGVLIATYESAKKASEETGLCLSTIYHTVGGRYNKTEGFMWRYL